MKVDIICPLYDAEKSIESLHNSLLLQEKVELHQIKYLLTESQDNTENLLKSLKLSYEKIKKEEFSHSLTREKAAYVSQADILVFITQDIEIENKMWLYNLIQPILNGECSAAFSKQICNNNTIEKYTREFNYPETSYINTKEEISKKGLKAFFFSDAASAIEKKVFIELNGYDQKRLLTNEDMYIAYKLITNGYKIKYCANSEVIHSHKFTWKQLWKRYYDTGVFFGENSYLEQYKITEAGAGLAKYVLKRVLKEKNGKALLEFFPNMIIRFIAMKWGKKSVGK